MSRTLDSPRGRSEKLVHVAVEKAGAADVRITGSFCGWDRNGRPLRPGSHGVWYGTLHLPPGRHEYRLLADGVWCDDPTCAERVPNGFGSQNCVLTIA